MASSIRWGRRSSTSTNRGVSSPGAAITSSRPQVDYEQVGDVPNVVFPCATVMDGANDRITVYYGAADTVTGIAHGHLSEILASLRG